MNARIPRIVIAVIAPAAVLAALIAPFREQQSVSAQPAGKPLTAELTYVPADAAFFIHADAAKLWNGPLAKSVRAADPKLIEELSAGAESLFGSRIDSLLTVTLFWPKFKGPTDPANFGAVLTFKNPYDKAKLKAGFENIVQPNAKVAVVEVSPRIAVVLAGLDPKVYGKPQSGTNGPLEVAIREAGTGTHALTIGATPANLPDEIRGDNLPQEVRAFQPLFFAESLFATIDLEKELTLDIRVKSSTPPRAKEVEKALGFLATLAGDTLGQGIKELSKGNEPELKDVVKIVEALQTGVKDAKFSTEGEVTRVTAKTSADLPFATAFIAAKRKAQEAAARATSSNNLKQIALALHNYESANASLPPGAVCDRTGKPILSWRVLILPYIEQDNLYKQFKLDEPWDSENNKILIAKMPKTYALPGVPGVKANETHYRGFVGNGAAWDYLAGGKLREFADGTSNTLLVVTAKDSVIWSKPDELAYDPDKDMRPLLGFFHGGACVTAFGDGSVRTLTKKTGMKFLHAAITKNGGEVVLDDE